MPSSTRSRGRDPRVKPLLNHYLLPAPLNGGHTYKGSSGHKSSKAQKERRRSRSKAVADGVAGNSATLLLFGAIALSSFTLLYIIVHLGPSTSIRSIPSSIQEVQQLYSQLIELKEKHFAWLLVAFCYLFVLKQTFSIPGSAILNLIAGAVFGLPFGFPLVCLLTAIGASCCYWLSHFFGRGIAARFFPQQTTRIEEMIKRNWDNLFYFLLFLRLFPMSPNFLLNMSSPLVGVPFHLFFFSVLFGLMPYNYICIQSGTILPHLQPPYDILDAWTVLKLACMAFTVLVPMLFRKKIKKHFAMD